MQLHSLVSGKDKTDKGSSRGPSISTGDSKHFEELVVVQSVCDFSPVKTPLFIRSVLAITLKIF